MQQAYNPQAYNAEKRPNQLCQGIFLVAFAKHTPLHLGIPTCPMRVFPTVFTSFSSVPFRTAVVAGEGLTWQHKTRFARGPIATAQWTTTLATAATYRAAVAPAALLALSSSPRKQLGVVQNSRKRKNGESNQLNFLGTNSTASQQLAAQGAVQAVATVRNFHIYGSPKRVESISHPVAACPISLHTHSTLDGHWQCIAPGYLVSPIGFPHSISMGTIR